jgi:hypothetical protein
MKKIILFLLLSIFGFGLGFSQDKGITYQAVIYHPGGEELPGQNNSISPLVNSNICLKFSFKDYLQNIEYQEIIRTRTDDFGLINLVIGVNEQTAGYANGFNDVLWNSAEKFLTVELDTTDACTDFEEISNEVFNYVPFAFSAVNTQNVLGIVSIENGGTGASTVADAKINLELNNVENTNDLNKPISTATQSALNLKEDATNKSTDVSTDGTSDVMFPTVKSVKTYVDAEITATNGTSGTALATLQADVDQNESDSDAAETTLQTNINTLTSNVATNATTAATASAAVQTNVNANETASNTADTTLQSNIDALTTGSNAAIALKEDAANKSTDVYTDGTSDVMFPTVKSVKTYVDAEITATNGTSGTVLATLQADVDQNESDSDAAETTLQTNINTLGATVATNATNIASNDTDIATNASSISTNVTNIAANTTTGSTNATNIASNDTDIVTNALGISTNVTNIAANTAKTGITSGQASAITANTAKTGITSQQSSDITTNNAKVGITTTQANEIAANTLKAGITAQQSSDITANNSKTGITTQQASDITTNNSKIGITTQQAADILSNNAKVGFTDALVANKANLTSPDFSGIPTAPTAASGTNTTQLATTAFVTAANTTNANLTGPITSVGNATSVASQTGTGTKFVMDTTPTLVTPVLGVATATTVNKLTLTTPATSATLTLAQGSTLATVGAFLQTLTATGNTNVTLPTAGTLATLAGTETLTNKTITAPIISTITNTGTLTLPTTTGTIALTSDITSATGNFVDLTNNQTIAGVKTFSSDVVVNGITIGLGKSSIATNTAAGKQALNANTTGFYNTAFGVSSLFTNTSGARNTAIGSQVLYNNNGYDNTALGYITLQNNTSGSYNVGVGSEVLFNNTTGGFNTALGSFTLKSNVGGASNTAIGYQALSANTSGGSNTATGQNSLPSNTTGTYNVAYGVQSLEQSTSANQNTAIGVAAIDRNTTGSSNAVLGAFAGRYISDGATYNTIINNSVLIGAETKPNADSESNQIVIGYQAKGNGSNTIQLGNTSITNVKTSGTLTAGAVTIPNTHGSANQVLTTSGSGTLAWSTPASSGATNIDGLSDALVESNSIYLGKDPSGTTDNANYNVSVGISALNFITTGDNNVAVGFQSLYANTTGSQNTAIGVDVMRFNTDGQLNTAVGKSSLYKNTTGVYNTSSGAYSLHNNTTNSYGAAFGYKALYLTTGQSNTGLGYQAGDLITTGTNNVIIGKDADPSFNSATNQIVIGYNAIGAGDNTVQLGNTDITDVKTSGTVTAGAVTYPNAHGTSDQVLSTTGSGTLTWTTPAAGGPIYKQSRVYQNSATGTADSEIEVGGMAFRYNKESLKIEVIKTTNLESEWQLYNTSLIVNGASQALVRGGILSTYSSWQELNGSFTISGYYNSYEFEMTPYIRGQASDNHSFNIKVLLDGWGIVTLRVIYY